MAEEENHIRTRAASSYIIIEVPLSYYMQYGALTQTELLYDKQL